MKKCRDVSPATWTDEKPPRLMSRLPVVTVHDISLVGHPVYGGLRARAKGIFPVTRASLSWLPCSRHRFFPFPLPRLALSIRKSPTSLRKDLQNQVERDASPVALSLFSLHLLLCVFFFFFFTVNTKVRGFLRGVHDVVRATMFFPRPSGKTHN